MPRTPLQLMQGGAQTAGVAFTRRLVCLIVLAMLPPLPVQASGWQYDNSKHGLEWSDDNSGSYLWLGLRGQGRYTSNETPLRDPDDFEEDASSDWSMNRSRYKIGLGVGHHFTGYHEFDLRDKKLLDLRGTWKPDPRFHLRAGQWKAEYNRERTDSSGKQQFVERSISTYWFTLDRQWGLMGSGRLWAGEAADSSWWAGILAGSGRSTSADGGRPMTMARWQWNYTRNLLPFSQSALKRYEQPHGSLALSLAANDSRYTRFSSSGGGQLQGYVEGRDNQYRLYQAVQEWAWQHHGLSVQQELHYKSVEDRRNGGTQHLYGGYGQVGWFPADKWRALPEQLEFALRGAYVDSDSVEDLENIEITLASNWFVNGHRNKITVDLSYLNSEDNDDKESDYLFRVQWDLSI